MENMKTVRLGGTTVTVTSETYKTLVKTNPAVAMQDALARRDYSEYNRLRRAMANAHC